MARREIRRSSEAIEVDGALPVIYSPLSIKRTAGSNCPAPTTGLRR